jgi:putative colanic acid biosynthesis acetyltransferase WcaF
MRTSDPSPATSFSPEPDPAGVYTRPAAAAVAGLPDLSARQESDWSFREKVGRALWMFARGTVFRWSFHNWYRWRAAVLRAFGATVGRDVRIRPTAWIEIPWNLEVGDHSSVGDHAILYSLGRITLGRGVVVSQYAHLCAGTHDYTSRRFPLLRTPIRIEDEAWVAADAFIGPGVTVGARAVVGARSSAFHDVPPDQVVGGSPARVIKPRVLRD